MQAVQQKWDRIYAKADASGLPAPCEVLAQYSYLLPDNGTALDLACGLGGNALLLAQCGLDTTALDISSVAIEKLAGHNHASIRARCEAIDKNSFNKTRYDAIVVSKFLDRSICGAIADALSPGGLLFYQTFVLDKTTPEAGPGNPDYLLKSNELLSLFSGLVVLAYSDIATVGDSSHGLRNQSYLVAQRRS